MFHVNKRSILNIVLCMSCKNEQIPDNHSTVGRHIAAAAAIAEHYKQNEGEKISCARPVAAV